LVGYPSLIPDTVTLVKYFDGEPSAFSRYPLIATGDPPPRSDAGSPVPTGLPLIAVIVSPPSGSLPSAIAFGLLRMLATVSRGVSVVVWMLPLDVLYTTVIGFPALFVVAACRSVVTSLMLFCRMAWPLIARMVSPDVKPAVPAA